MQRGQDLPTGCVRGSMKEHLDLRVIAPRRVRSHPTARLEVEVLKIVVWSLANGFLVQDLPMLATLTTAVYFGEIREEEARAVKQRRQRAVMIEGQWINSRFDIGEVLPEQGGHIRVKALPVWHWESRTRGLTGASARCLGKLPHGYIVSDVPGYPWELARAISQANGEAGKRIDHAGAERVLRVPSNMGGTVRLLKTSLPDRGAHA
jgi:hypothetical protein